MPIVFGYTPMNFTYENLRAEVLEVAGAQDLTAGESAMYVMTRLVATMAPDLPQGLRGALAAAGSRWLDRSAVAVPLEQFRVSAWEFLDARGTSLTPRDRSDIAVRALVCVCWDRPFEVADMEDALEFFAGLVDQYQRPSLPST